MKSGLEKIQEELEFQPPEVLSLEDTDVANGMLNGHTPVHSEPGCPRGSWKHPGFLYSFCGLHRPVLSVPVLQSSPDSEGAADAGLHLPGQCVPARAEEHLANPLPRRSGFSVFISDPDQTAAGEAI